MEPIVRLEEVSTIYEGERRPAIRNVSLKLNRKELVYVIGPNAAGKTTLLETINGLLPVSKGEVNVFGLDVQKRRKEVRRNIGYVPQDFMVGPHEPYTAFDIVLMGRYGKLGVLRRPDREDRTISMEAMRCLGVDDLAKRPVGKLSGGQQQKVMIARALAKQPRVLLLDEPFSNLDPESRQKIPEFVSQIHDERQMTTVIVTHDVHQILSQCRRVVVMNNGRIVADESPGKALELMDEPLRLDLGVDS